MYTVGSRKTFLQNKNSLMLSGVAPTAVPKPILQHLSSLGLFENLARLREDPSLGSECTVAEQEEAKTSWFVISLVFTQDHNPQHCYITQRFSTSAKDRSTVKSQEHCYHHHLQNWPCSGLSGLHRKVCLQLTDTPSLARQVLKGGGDLLTHPLTRDPLSHVDMTDHRGVKGHLFTS